MIWLRKLLKHSFVILLLYDDISNPELDCSTYCMLFRTAINHMQLFKEKIRNSEQQLVE